MRWRWECVRSRQGHLRRTAMDEILEQGLELVPSGRHNDLVLCCLSSNTSPLGAMMSDFRLCGVGMDQQDEQQPQQQQQHYHQLQHQQQQHQQQTDHALDLHMQSVHEVGWVDNCCIDSDSVSRSCSSGSTPSSLSLELQREVALLRSENQALRNSNKLLAKGSDGSAMFSQLFFAPSRAKPFFEPDVFDDPFEPPPQAFFLESISTCTCTPSDWGLASGSITPCSGMATPAMAVELERSRQVCTVMPVWFSLGDRSPIPFGIVSQAKTLFERSNSIPSWFVQPTPKDECDVTTRVS